MTVKLEISSFGGISLGAEHYYGKFFYDRNKGLEIIEIQKPLTQKECLYLNKKDECLSPSRHKPGDLSDRFGTREELITFALKTFKQTFDPNKDVLMLGDYASLSAQKVLHAPPKFKKIVNKINKLAEKWEKIDGYEGNHDLASKIDDEFYELYKKLC